MKVYDVYDKDSKILDHGRNIFKTTEKYLANFPEQYSKCYKRNLETLELIKVDRLSDTSQAGLKNPEAYSFEVFAVMMLEHIPNIFESFFVPREKGIFSVFPSKKDMYTLLCSLDLYNEMTCDYLSQLYAGEDGSIDLIEIVRTIKHVIDSLISIELSLYSDRAELINYADKFMDLINSDFISEIVREFYPRYDRYADKQIKKRIRERD